MKRTLAVVCLIAASAHAGSKAIAVAAGDCRDPELLTAATAFSDAVGAILKNDALDPFVVLERLRPRQSATVEDVQRQLEAARAQFYADQFDKALEGVRSAASSLERLPPSDVVARQIQTAWLLEGLIYKSLNRKNEQLRAWRRVLRTAPEFRLDPNEFSPSAIAQFDQLRLDIARSKKVALSVTTTAGATVFVDGVRVGLAPLTGFTLVPGAYRIVVVAGDVQSFVYNATLEAAPVDVAIDLSFEGSLRPQLPLCVNGAEAAAIKLAAREGADRLVVVSVDGTTWITTTLIDVRTGTRVRQGGMKVSEARGENGYADLATFVLTGQPARLALSNRAAEVEPPPPERQQPAPVLPQEREVLSPQETPVAVVTPEPQPEVSRAPRAISGVVAGAGVVAVGVGVGTWLAGSSDRAAFASAVDANGVVDTQVLDAASAGALERRIGTNQAVATGLMLGGGLAAVGGAVLFFILAPGDSAKPTVMLTPNGAYAGITGSF